MTSATHNSVSDCLRPEHLRREAVLLTFCDPPPEACSRLEELSGRQWQKLLRWIHVSGLALYFLDRVTELQRREVFPPSVLERLQRALQENIARTAGLAAESVAIQKEFQRAGLSYALLKGISLCPRSVPRAELRHQFDIDFLMAEGSSATARSILERRGYRLYAIGGRSWEFKTRQRPVLALDDIYRDSPGRTVELHIDAGSGVLNRTQNRDFYGMRMPVLSSVDLFLGQGLHIYKHVCGGFVRASHLLEFRRHILSRRGDDVFWAELRRAASENPRSALGLGIATQLIARTMGSFAPAGLTCWTVDSLPRLASDWIDLYGPAFVLGNFPGSKLHLLLQKELETSGLPPTRSRRQTLLPGNLPPRVVHPVEQEALAARWLRYRLQLAFVLCRLRFHVVEGLRYARESYRWRRRIAGVAR